MTALEESNRPNYLFVAGAARSGTTLLMNLLDGHPSVLVFPLEHSLFRTYFDMPETERAEFFRTKFISARSAGQQAVLASDKLLNDYRSLIMERDGSRFLPDIDTRAFRRGYLESINSRPVTIGSVLDSLSHGLVTGSKVAGRVIQDAKWILFKAPFSTERWAKRTADEVPGSNFLHIIRNPYARYASAKKRRIKGASLGRQVVARKGQLDFVSSLARISISSLSVGISNRSVLGTRYRLIRFEDILEDPEATLRVVAEWLSIPFHPTILKPSKLGQPADSGSSFDQTRTIDISVIDRRDQYIAITTAAERDLFARYLAVSGYDALYRIAPPQTDRQRLLTWLAPFKYERWRDYAWRLRTRSGWLNAVAGELEDFVSSQGRARFPDQSIGTDQGLRYGKRDEDSENVSSFEK